MREAFNPEANLALLDGKTNSIPAVATSLDLVANGNTTAQDIQLTYRPREEQTEIAKFVYSGRRTVVVEIPFTLNNVPLAH